VIRLFIIGIRVVQCPVSELDQAAIPYVVPICKNDTFFVAALVNAIPRGPCSDLMGKLYGQSQRLATLKNETWRSKAVTVKQSLGLLESERGRHSYLAVIFD
jgi:hypothetical protein